MKERINKLDFIKIQYFCSVKDTVKRMGRQASFCNKKIFAKDTFNKSCIQNIQRSIKTDNPDLPGLIQWIEYWSED